MRRGRVRESAGTDAKSDEPSEHLEGAQQLFGAPSGLKLPYHPPRSQAPRRRLGTLFVTGVHSRRVSAVSKGNADETLEPLREMHYLGIRRRGVGRGEEKGRIHASDVLCLLGRNLARTSRGRL